MSEIETTTPSTPVVNTPKTAKAKRPPKAKGGTKSLLYHALRRTPKMSMTAIRKATGLPANSGYLAVLLLKEVEAKRIAVGKGEYNGRTVNVYSLTAAGTKAMTNGALENSSAGVRLGKGWSKARIKAEKARK